ncbi:MAG: hypothetical protein K0R38_2985 [Polyangiaceae bacterium]|jgi:uncharacterized iron-regulated membrane protein|nr:hypothetical protein [Polyangiaceae bacterium]
MRKLSPSTYQAWWDLHAWAGVLASLIAYVMFFFGAWTLFRTELYAWQEARGPVPTLSEVDRTLDASIASGAVAPQSMRLFLPGPASADFSLQYTDGLGKGRSAFVLATGLVEARSDAADFLYGMHYLQPPDAPAWLYVVAGLAAGLLLLILVTGVLIHLRHLLSRMHQFRPGMSRQVLWSDAHKVLGTLGLPFVAVYAFTGAWMGLESVLGTALAKYVFHGNEAVAAVVQFGPPTPHVQPVSRPGTRLPLAELLARAHEVPPPPGVLAEQVAHCRSVYLRHVGDHEATAELRCGPASVLLRQRDGSRVPFEQAPPPLAQKVSELPYALHFVEQAGMPLRALYAVLTLAGCLTILTGNWLWLERRTANRGTWLVQRLTLATGAGSLVASAAMLLASRVAISSSFERHVFWWSWLAAGSACCVFRGAPRLWRAALALAGGLFVATSLPGLTRLKPMGVDFVLLTLGVGCLALGYALRRARVGRPLVA